MGLFSKADTSAQKVQIKEVKTQSWYTDRYEMMVVQRNVLFLLSVICIITTIIAVVVMGKLASSKTIEPMVITVEDKSGITNIVNPQRDRTWSADKALNQYFLNQYIDSREGYDAASYLYKYNSIVRLMSTGQVFADFNQYINDAQRSPVIRYGAFNSTSVKIRSIQFLPDSPNGDKNVQIRFTVIENSGARNYYNRIVYVMYNFVEMELTNSERMVNPLGFQVKSYSVSDDVELS
jgi:type IV secretion system protein VirB8